VLIGLFWVVFLGWRLLRLQVAVVKVLESTGTYRVVLVRTGKKKYRKAPQSIKHNKNEKLVPLTKKVELKYRAKYTLS